jgi:3-hydroxyisobutyrate dehydrogenase-like beta-hydroxyacid dehydrogenase
MTVTVGLIGLGFIGASIGERLTATGQPPVVYDVVPDRVETLAALGASAASSVRNLAERCDVVLVCVQNDAQCLEVITGHDGVLAAARAGAVVCVLSTISPQTIETLAARAEKAGVGLIEAPMAGQGAKSVADASMFVLAGGDAKTRERARPTLERFSSVLDVGPLGSGAALKLAHNVMVYVSRIGALEAVELARAAGVPDGLVAELTGQTGTLSEQSAVWLRIYEARRRGETDPTLDANMTVAADLLAKDLRHAVDLGAKSGIALPASTVAAAAGDQIYLVRQHAPTSDASRGPNNKQGER